MKVIRQIYLYVFYIFKLNNIKVIHDLYPQYLNQTLSKTIFFMSMEGILVNEYMYIVVANNSVLLNKKITFYLRSQARSYYLRSKMNQFLASPYHKSNYLYLTKFMVNSNNIHDDTK